MRLIDAEPFDFNKVVIPDGGPNFMRGYGLGAKHVCDEIDSAPTIEAVPLDELCDWLAEKAVFFANDNDSDPEAWKETIKEHVMEETNANQT